MITENQRKNIIKAAVMGRLSAAVIKANGVTTPLAVKIRTGGDQNPVQQLDGLGWTEYKVFGGQHNGHSVVETTHKSNCGAVWVERECKSCGASAREWIFEGCWQQGHNREVMPEYDNMGETPEMIDW